ncbi:hypothetical protein ASG87_11735 [Frateuria sp. Soil773]|uniref:surface lipoprotein assembly modifier n=1 Tax=Frateuria sp. Soil773 TaxID=1736407 RepID=UPI0006F8EC15|nr:outer membrane beta-barrel protein [Frateuria sp. Soil773]KRF02142.1 hypothetical protein ASG87_11735 [Frateuria sp. Soil773]
MPASITLARAVAFALAVAPGVLCAAQLDYTVYADLEHSNNITLSPNNPVSQNVLTPGIGFAYRQQGSVLQASVVGNLEYRDYLGGRFDNQTRTQLAGQGNWTVLPQRLDFSVEDYAGVQPIDTLVSNGPNNLQQTNVLSLGPTLHLRFGNALTAQAELRYIDSYASKVDEFDSSRGLAAFRVYRALGPTAQLSFNVEAQRVRFDNHADLDFDRTEAYLRYTSKLARFDADVLLGWSRLDFSHAPDQSKPLARLTLDWRPTLRSTFTLAGVYQYSDAAQDLMQPLDMAVSSASGGAIGTGNAVINAQVYLDRRVEATYAFHDERLTLSVTPIYGKLHYLNDRTLDQTSRGVGMGLAYRLRPTLTLSAFANGERMDYSRLDRRDRTIRLGLDLSQQWTPHWSWHASVIRQRRNSNAAEQSYRETEIFFGVAYRR